MKKIWKFGGLGLVLGTMLLSGCAKNGLDGNQILTGTATPTAEIGNIGDLYYDEDDNLLYKKNANGDWVVISTLKGDKGDSGMNGTNGSNGQNGKDGSNGLNGSNGSNGQNGKDGSNGINGSNGQNGKDGSNGVNGSNGSNGKDGSNGINGSNGKDGSQGPQGDSGAQGPQGDSGAQGPQGDSGEQGPKGDTGDQGPAGQNGADGATWLTGSGAPSDSLGKKGDLYLNTLTFDVYQKGDSTWSIICNIKGADGKDGEAAGKGEDGADGKDGATWLVGSGTPTATSGVKGDLYLDSATFNVYQKGDSQWTLIGNIKGQAGADGKTPYIGENGNWWIGTTDLEVKAQGDTPTVEIINGFWYINGENTGVSAIGSAASTLYGKTVSILGDSISTYSGYIPQDHRARYPQANLDMPDVDHTWWQSLINDTGAVRGMNDSWAGSRVSNSSDTNSGDQGPDRCMASMTRIRNLAANGTPDIIFFYGGTNDVGGAVTLGDFDPTATYSYDGTSTKWASFSDAYRTAIMRMEYLYPTTKIVAMIPTYTSSYYTPARLNTYAKEMIEICDYFGVDYVDLRKAGITPMNVGSYLNDGIHPNAKGMKLIENQLLNYVKGITLEDFDVKVCQVIQTLSHVNSSNSETRVFAGSTFTTTLSAKLGYKIKSVQVLYGDDDITNTAYNTLTGVVTITNVEKPIKIIATGEVDGTEVLVPATDNDHCQSLPLGCDNNTNLWNVLEHEEVYWGTSGAWETNEAVGSITFPVTPGQHIYCQDFGGSKGIRVTYFKGNDVVASYDPSTILGQFTANGGYIVVPQGADTVNVPVWDRNAANNVVKILNLVEVKTVAVTQTLTNVSSTFSENQIEEGKNFSTTLSAFIGYKMDDVEVKYGGDDVTESAYNATTGVVSIENVTKAITITASAVIDESQEGTLPTTTNSHASALPANLSNTTNLWTYYKAQGKVEDVYYTSSGWAAVNPVKSITFPVMPGYHIYANSFQKKGTNNGNSDGIRVTYFNNETVVNSIDPGVIYNEYKNNGYITVPSGVNCVNVPLWSDDNANQVFILNAAPAETVNVTQSLTNVVSTYSGNTIEKGTDFVAKLSGATGYKVDSVTVLYGEDDVTETAYDSLTRTVTITNVSKEIKITASGVEGTDPVTLPTTTNTHASALPSDMTSETNLWDKLSHSNEYYLGDSWGTNSIAAPDCASITFPVKPGYRIDCNAFKSNPTNESPNGASGIRITFFNGDTVVKSLSPTETYAEYTKGGHNYIEIPDGVDCINVPVWNKNSANNFVKIINFSL